MPFKINIGDKGKAWKLETESNYLNEKSLGDKIHGNFEIKLLENGLFVAAEKVERRGYLDVLRTKEGFKQAAELLGIEENLEGIASSIYKTS